MTRKHPTWLQREAARLALFLGVFAVVVYACYAVYWAIAIERHPEIDSRSSVAFDVLVVFPGFLLLLAAGVAIALVALSTACVFLGFLGSSAAKIAVGIWWAATTSTEVEARICQLESLEQGRWRERNG